MRRWNIITIILHGSRVLGLSKVTQLVDSSQDLNPHLSDFTTCVCAMSLQGVTGVVLGEVEKGEVAVARCNQRRLPGGAGIFLGPRSEDQS